VDRLFVAALPDETTVEVLRGLPRPDERGVQWVPEENWHVTLRFLGTCDTTAVIERLGAAELPSCGASLGPAVDWLGPQLVVPTSGVADLAAAVHGATAGIGEPPRPRFRGHLTIARTRRAATSTLLGHPVSAAFDVDEVSLVRSDLTPDGPRYTKVATFRTV
jgi:2'-5' RNA ligase